MNSRGGVGGAGAGAFLIKRRFVYGIMVAEDRDRRKGNHLLLEGTKRDAEDRIPCSVDADVEVKSDKRIKVISEACICICGSGRAFAMVPYETNGMVVMGLVQERQQQEDELKVKEAELIRENLLLSNPTSFSVKRRWGDDVVFKNQARGEAKTPKRFINYTICNDFHQIFLQKYMK
ncbi:hypothetical protein LguiA_035720 [Lonicera macranthoides]